MSPNKLFTIGFYTVALLVTLVAYSGISDGYLYNDDFEWLSKARHEMTAGNILTYRVVGGFIRPVVNLSFFVTERIAPGNISVYYYTNILLHFLNSILVFHLFVLLFAALSAKRVVPVPSRTHWVAGAIALYFLVASFHSAGVFWISARTTLFSTYFLLLTLVVLLRPSGRWSLASSTFFYVLALASKETAVVGVLLVVIMYAFVREKSRTSLDRRSLSILATVTVVYVVVRKLTIGGLVQENWGPGLHVLRNLGGGFLYQLWPWNEWVSSSTSGGAIWPEVLALPLLALLIYIGTMANKKREMLVAVWSAIASLIPVALWKFRFLSTAVVTHDRYYYLSSIGVCAAVVVMLWILWDSRRYRRAARAAAVIVLMGVYVSAFIDLGRRVDRWKQATLNRKGIVSTVERQLDRFDDVSTCVVERSSQHFDYLRHALLLERPRWTLIEVANLQEGRRHAPCVYLRFIIEGSTIVSIETLEMSEPGKHGGG